MHIKQSNSPLRRIEELPELLTRSELAHFTDISVPTFARWMVEGRGPVAVKLGHAVRYRKIDVLDWIESAVRSRADQPSRVGGGQRG